jgi:hypothetical protein
MLISREPYFVEKVRQSGLHLIAHLRDGIVMRYPYLGAQKEGRGRDKTLPRVFREVWYT